MKRYLIVPGAGRSGSTFLYELLKQHPQIFASKIKELRFFNKDSEYKKGIQHYNNFFEGAMNNQLLLDISPEYFYSGFTVNANNDHHFKEMDDSPIRIHQLIANKAQILILLRNPVNRLYSEYVKNFFQGKEKETLENALKLELNGLRTHQNSVYCWIYKNNYLLHIQKWLTFFPNTKFLLFEEWINSPSQFLNPVLNSLDLDSYEFKTENVRKNETTKYLKKWRKSNFFQYLLSRYPQKINENHKNLLKEILLNDINQIENLTQLNLKIWKQT